MQVDGKRTGLVTSRRQKFWVFLTTLRWRRSTGPDGSLLRGRRVEITGALTEMFVSSLDTGDIPK